MKSIFKYTFLCLMALSGYGQKQNANWAISTYGGLNFNSSPPTTFTSAMDFINLSSGSVSDQEGNLLFYTDGLTVWDQTHSTMANGTGLYGFGGDFAQNIVIVPNPADINKYYIFYISVGQDLGQTLHGLRYSEVDMTDGIGVVDNTTKNTPLTDNSLVDIDDTYSPNYGKITSARHANGLDYWLIAEIGSDIFSYLIDDSGIHVNATASTAPLPSAWYWFINGSQTGSSNGPIKISPDNTKILIGYTSAFDAGHSEQGQLFEGLFDDSTGLVSDFYHLTIPSSCIGRRLTGAEFSPNNDIIHRFYEAVSAVGYNVQSTVTYATVWDEDGIKVDNTVDARNLQRAIDGKLYFENGDTPAPPASANFLGVSNAPNNTSDYDYQFNSVDVGSSVPASNLPQWVQWQGCVRTLTTAMTRTGIDHIQRDNWIISADTINNPNPGDNVIYHAGDYIVLNPGFYTYDGSKFTAYIEDCTGNYAYRPSSDSSKAGREPQSMKVSSVKDLKAGQIKIYPNPSSRSITISYDTNLRNIKIISMDGKIILDQNARETIHEIDVSSFAKGIYLISVETEDGKILKSKFIKD